MRIFNDTNRFTVDWTLNTLCTYHCSYCPETLHRGNNFIRSKEKDPEYVEKFLTKLAEEVKGRSVHVFLNGGEPTISPVFEQIIDFVYKQGWCAYVNTNGSRSLDWWKDYAHKIYKITISYHPETVVDSEIFEKVNYIKTQTNVGVFTLMYPPLWDKAVNAYNSFKDMGVTIAASRVWKRNLDQPQHSYDYTEEQLAWLDSNSAVIFNNDNSVPPPDNNYFGFSFIEDDSGNVENFDEVETTNKRKNKFTDWECNMGIDHITINGQGGLLHSTCPQAYRFGHVSSFSGLIKNSTICKTEYCMCTLDTLIPKKKLKNV